MGSQNSVNMRLRAAFILPAIAIELGLAALAYAVPDLLQPLIVAMPVVLVAALATLFVVEQTRRRGNPSA